MSYERLPGETDQQLFLRICKNKEDIGSWKKVAEVLNEALNQHLDESTYRRRFKGYQPKDETLPLKTDASVIDKTEQLRRERLKIQTLNIERNRIDRAEIRQELFYEQVGQYIKALPVPEFKEITPVPYNGLIEYIVTISDVHYNACFDSQNNEYSPEIAKKRFDYLASYLSSFVAETGIEKIHIISLGDSIQGLIHLSDIKINDTSFVKSVVEYSRLMASFLNELSNEVDIEYYHTPTANHTQLRSLNSKPNELPVEDVEYIIGHYIKDLLRDNQRVNVNLAKAEGQQFIHTTINGYEVVAMHGHTVKNIDTVIDDVSGLLGLPVDYLFLGHYHKGTQISVREVPGLKYDTEVILCPSFVGSDPYSDRCMKSSKPACKIFGIDEEYGLIETYKIVL